MQFQIQVLLLNKNNNFLLIKISYMATKGGNTGGKGPTNPNKPSLTNIPKQTAKDKIPANQVQQLRQVFDLFDEDHGGSIDPIQIQGVLEQLGLDRRNPRVFEIISELKERNKAITFDDFLEIVVGKVGDVKTKAGLQTLFNVYDSDNSGYIDFEKLKAIGRELGQTLNDDQILEMMHHIHILNNTESNEYLNFNDFYKIISKRKY